MILNVPAPRLLPLTIGLLAAVLAMKSVTLVRAATATGEKPAQETAAAAPASGQGHGASGPPTAPPPAGAAAPQSAAPTQAAETAPKPPEEPPVSDSERAVLLELRERRQALDTREMAIAARESVLAAAEKKLSSRVEELQALQTQLAAMNSAREQREDKSWDGLVRTYESMKPRDAATIFNDLDMKVLLQVLDRMKANKAALVLSAMDPDKARDVTTALAKMRTKRDEMPTRAPSEGGSGKQAPAGG